jgi:hypothetical protein
LTVGRSFLNKLVRLQRQSHDAHKIPDSMLLDENLYCTSMRNICTQRKPRA